MDKLRKRLYQVSEGLELIIALVAVVGVVIAAVNLFPGTSGILAEPDEWGGISYFSRCCV